MLRANPPPPFSMLYKKEANSRDRKFNIEKGGEGSIVEIRKEICLKYSKMIILNLNDLIGPYTKSANFEFDLRSLLNHLDKFLFRLHNSYAPKPNF